MSAAAIVADLVVGGVEALTRLRESADEREREAAREALERVRAALDEIPIRTGPDGTWTRDTARRVAEVEVPVGERETLPPNPFEEPDGE